MPIIQLILLALAADFEVKNLKLYIVDQDGSAWSQRLVQQFEGSAYFILADYGVDLLAADQAMHQGEADLILTIPPNGEKDLKRENRASIQLVANAIDGTKGVLASSYAAQVIQGFNLDLLTAYGPRIQPLATPTGEVVSWSISLTGTIPTWTTRPSWSLASWGYW